MSFIDNSSLNLSYSSRIQNIDRILSWLERKTTGKKTTELQQHIKFYMLITFHVILFIPIYIIIIYSKNIGLMLFAMSILYIQLMFNILDNGCFLMKLERKYIGKKWYGFYTPIVWLFDLETQHINTLFYIFAIIVLGYTSQKCYSLL